MSAPDQASTLRAEARSIARLAAPITLAQLGLMTIGLVDVAVLGHVSASDLGGAGIGRSITFAAGSIGLGIAGALDPLASQAIGARDERRAWDAFVATTLAALLVWVPSAVFAVAATSALRPLGVAPSLVTAARAFVLPQLPGTLAFGIFAVTKSFVQAHGRAGAVVGASIVANIVNFAVCNVLVRGDEALVAVGLPGIGAPQLGAFGAGIANSVATSILAGWLLVAAWRLRPKERSTTNIRAPLAKVLRIGIPIGLQVLAEVGVFSFVSLLSGRLGSVAASAHNVAMSLASFTFMGAMGIGAATAVRVGRSIGEGRSPKRAGLVGIAMGAFFMASSAVVFLALRRTLTSVFSEDPSVIELGAKLLVVASAFQLFDGVQAVSSGALRGAADVRFAFFANVGAHWLVGLPLAIVLGFHARLGVQGLWGGLLGGLAVVAALLLWRFVTIAKGPIARA